MPKETWPTGDRAFSQRAPPGLFAFGERGQIHRPGKKHQDEVAAFLREHGGDRQREHDPGRQVASQPPPAVAHGDRDERAEGEVREGAIGAPGVGFPASSRRDLAEPVPSSNSTTMWRRATTSPA